MTRVRERMSNSTTLILLLVLPAILAMQEGDVDMVPEDRAGSNPQSCDPCPEPEPHDRPRPQPDMKPLMEYIGRTCGRRALMFLPPNMHMAPRPMFDMRPIHLLSHSFMGAMNESGTMDNCAMPNCPPMSQSRELAGLYCHLVNHLMAELMPMFDAPGIMFR